jgi:hypothetical protein
MSDSVSAGGARRLPFAARVMIRLSIILVAAFAFGAVLNRVAISLSRDPNPAGFGRGVVQGALMPMAFPNLLVGRDVAIYASNNTGVSYKLGYTTGVNGCGAIFFSFLFWRVARWRRAGLAKAAPTT